MAQCLWILYHSWYQGLANNTAIEQGVYYLWNNANNFVYAPAYRVPPFAQFVLNTVNGYNFTYGVVPFTFGCQSFSPSTNPWYQTTISTEKPADYPYMVVDGRPALSCWEEDIWSFRGNSSPHSVTGGRLSSAIKTMLAEYLYAPMIISMATRLVHSSLESSTTVFLSGFNANQSSPVADLNCLVNTTYIATRNILSDSTTTSELGRTGLLNAIDNINGSIPLGASDFVVSSPEIYTLPVRVLIIVPTIFVRVYVLVLVLEFLPETWRSTKELNATRMHKLKKQSAKSGKKKVKYVKTENGEKSEHIEVDVEIKSNSSGDGEIGSKEIDDKITSIGE